MQHTANLFDETPPARGEAPSDAIAFAIGWDHAHYRVVPPVEHLHAGHPVREGWQAGQSLFGSRTLRATHPVRKWLQLRLNAWLRGCAFESVQVTPNHLSQIDVPLCPITREWLTHATGQPSDASVDRVYSHAGYAAGNLAVMSVRANVAKGDCAWDDALRFQRQIEACQLEHIGGLNALQWSRLAVLMSFVTPLAHAQVACLPLLVLPPNRLRLLNPVQALQAVLTLQFTREGAPRRIGELADAVPALARHDFQVFMHTLLARRLAAGTGLDALALRHVMEDVWCDPLVNRRWQRVALKLSEADAERLVRYAGRAGLAGPWQWLDRTAAADGWALETQGYVRGLSASTSLVAAKMSHTATNIAAITGPMTKPLMPKIAMPPIVEMRTM
jgi:hypothetical protein